MCMRFGLFIVALVEMFVACFCYNDSYAILSTKYTVSNSYSNNDNPFGDPNLLDTFVWAKKHEKSEDGAKTKHDVLHKLQAIKQDETRNELEKVRLRKRMLSDVFRWSVGWLVNLMNNFILHNSCMPFS